jgi:chromate reductase
MADQILNVVCICGSLRKGSYNRMVMNALPALAPPNLKLAEAPPFAEFPLYNADMQEASGVPAAVQKLADAIRAADGVIFNSPEYNYSMPGGLKNAIDWVSRVRDHGEPTYSAFKGRVFAIGAAANSGNGGLRSLMALRQILELGCGALVIPEQIAVPRAEQAFDDRDNLKDESLMAALKAMARRLIELASLMREG